MMNLIRFVGRLSRDCMMRMRCDIARQFCAGGERVSSKYVIDTSQSRLSISEIRKVIKASGVSFEDNRVKSFLTVVNEQSQDSIINRDTFLSLLEKREFQLINKIFKDELAIPDFQSFSDHIRQIYSHCVNNQSGSVATYIPQLAKFSPHYWGVSLCTVDGQRFSIGDTKVNFCLQSTSKPINYALALTEIGAYELHKYVGYEPSGSTFNHITLNSENKPHNPMINSGAILICSLIKQHLNQPERFDFIFREFKKICGNEKMGFNNAVFMSEKSSADRNYALAYYMREYGCFPKSSNLQEVLDLYFQLCSLEADCESTSVIAATFANGGLCPTTQEKVLSPESVRDTLCLMHSCGMYDYSGQFAFKCGLPCKSGVSGSCLLVIPNLMGISLWSPPLDKQGNSSRALQFCMELIQKFNFHHFDSLLNYHNKIDPRRPKIRKES